MGRARLGVALLLGAELAGAVDGLRRALGDPALGRVPPHLTIVPPVNVAEARVPEALAVLRAAAAATTPIRLVLGPPNTFWPVNPVVYLQVTGDVDAVIALRQKVFLAPLARAVTLPFVPHVTLADGADPARIDAALAALADFVVTAEFDRVHLLEEGAGRVWAPVADAAFAPSSVVGRGGLELELAVTALTDPEAEAFAAAASAGAFGGEPFAVTARRRGTVVGLASGRTAGDEGRLERLVVDPAVRGEGIGSQLVARVEALAADRGCRLLAARVAASSRAAGFLLGRGWSPAPGPAVHDAVLVRTMS